jgi:hypothetical protein
MKVITKAVIRIADGKMIHCESYTYNGTIAKCDGGGGGGGGYDYEGIYSGAGPTGQEFTDAGSYSDTSSELDYSAGPYGPGGPTGEQFQDLQDFQTPEEATASLNAKALGVIKDTLSDPKAFLNPIGLPFIYAKNAFKVDLTPAEQAIYDADIAEANAADTSYDGFKSSGGDKSKQTQLQPKTAVTAKEPSNVVQAVRSVRESARRRRGLYSNILTSPLGLDDREANVNRRTLIPQLG